MNQIDDLYARFEERFRGSRETILARLEGYARVLELIEDSHPDRMAIDCGCGRGEWLELLTRRGWRAMGVDTNRRMLDEGAKHGLQGEQGDAVAYLAGLPDRSVHLLSAFHLVEHLPLASLLDLLGEMSRVVTDDGIVILETPNPENLTVGTSSFYLDPTHEKPIPPHLLQFYLDQAGMAKTWILRINGEALRDPIDSIEAALRPLFHRALDYAVIGLQSKDEGLLARLQSFVDEIGEPAPIDLEGVRALDRFKEVQEREMELKRETSDQRLLSTILEARDTIHTALGAVHNATLPLGQRAAGIESSVAGLGSALGETLDQRFSSLEARAADITKSIQALTSAGDLQAGRTDAIVDSIGGLSRQIAALAGSQARSSKEQGEREAAIRNMVEAAAAVLAQQQVDGIRQMRTVLDKTAIGLRDDLDHLEQGLRDLRLQTTQSVSRQTELIQVSLREALTMSRRNSDAREFRIVTAVESLRRTNNEALAQRQGKQADDRKHEITRQIEQATLEATERTTALFTNTTSWRLTAPLRAVAQLRYQARPSTPKAPPPGRGLLSNPWIWRIGRAVVHRVPGLRRRVLRVLNRKDLLVNPLIDTTRLEIVGPQFRDEEGDQLSDEQRIALMSSNVRRLYLRMADAQAVRPKGG